MNKNTGPILFFDTVTYYGGSKKVSVKLAEKIKKTQKVVFVDAYGNCKEFVNAVENSGIELKILKPGTQKGIIGGKGLMRFLCLIGETKEFFSLIKILKKEINRVKPDVIVVNCEKALFFLAFANKLRVPIVFYVMALFKRSFLTNFIWKKVNLLITISDNVTKHFLNVKPEPSKIKVIYNSLDLDEVNELAKANIELPEKTEALKILYPAGIGYHKAQHLAIQALGEFVRSGYNAHLWISGEPPRGTGNDYMRHLKSLIDEFELSDKVLFTGSFPIVNP